MIVRIDCEQIALNTIPSDEALMDLIEEAFFEGRIDGETLSLAFLWVESNDYVMH